jgi:hypothetical protein
MCILYYVWKNKKLRKYSNNGGWWKIRWMCPVPVLPRVNAPQNPTCPLLLLLRLVVSAAVPTGCKLLSFSSLSAMCVCTIIQMYGARPPTPVDAAVRDPASSAHTHCCAESTQQRNGRKYESVQTIDSLVTHTQTRIITLQQRPEVENIFSTVYSYFQMMTQSD